MPRRTATFFALLLTIAVTLPAAAQTSTRSRIAKQTAAQAATAFADAASTYEDIVNLHLADRRDALRLHLGSGRGALTRLRRFLKEDTAATLDRYNKEMETAEARGDLRTTALTAAEAYKTVLAAMNPKIRSAPIEVSMYKYWGYRLVVLASSEKILWREVAASSKESEKAWKILRRMFRDVDLRTMLEEAQRGLREAVERYDVSGVEFAARVQIASAAVLSDLFERMRTMAQSR